MVKTSGFKAVKTDHKNKTKYKNLVDNTQLLLTSKNKF